MKALVLMILAIAAAGCATLGTAPGAPVGGGSAGSTAGIDFAPATTAPFPNQNIGPRTIMPVTGSAPVFGIPLGGDMYLPVTGGAPVIGMPITP